jgi:hypothetical protein
MLGDAYFIDVGRDNEGYKLYIRDTSGNIIKIFDNSDYLVYQAWREVSQLIENYDLILYGRIRMYKDGDMIFDFFKRFLFTIILEQDASYLANLEGYKIKYPDFNFYIATLYKIYKAYVNPRSTMDPQEFVIMIAPLLNRIRFDMSGSELSYLFDTFAANYYGAIDYINRSRIGLNFMPAIQKPMTAQPATAATQPNIVIMQPSKVTKQPKVEPAKQSNAAPKPVVIMQAPAPAPAPTKATPKEEPKVVKPSEETNKIKLEKREVTLEEKKPIGPPTLEDEPFDKIKQEANLENKTQNE